MKVRPERTDSDNWVRTGDVIKIEIQNRGSVRHTLDFPYQDTYVKIFLQAHNELGFSAESVLIVRVGNGKKIIFSIERLMKRLKYEEKHLSCFQKSIYFYIIYNYLFKNIAWAFFMSNLNSY